MSGPQATRATVNCALALGASASVTAIAELLRSVITSPAASATIVVPLMLPVAVSSGSDEVGVTTPLTASAIAPPMPAVWLTPYVTR